ncbi:hypothetical protein [Paenibacillus lactis]|uniref:hypothetical protein n=1 Tax=Paenibacillus lactis TaxID=228574 RepID=UPI003D71E516
MPGVALNSAPIQEAVSPNYVSYVERYISGYSCVSWDQFGNCTRTEPDYSTVTHYSNAMINGNVRSSHTVFVNGVSVATVDDSTQEQWVADPTPSPKNGGTIISISPGPSGSGSGSVTVGSATVFVNGKALAYSGSAVNTHLGTPSSITSGSSNVFVN